MAEKATPTTNLTEALLAVQGAAETLHKTSQANLGTFSYKYTDIAAIVEKIGPLLNANGLVWTTLPGSDEQGRPNLTYRLIHATTAEALAGTMPLLLGKNDMQAYGSALTYARRYALLCVLNLVTDDDDGRAASERPAAQSRQANGNGSAPDMATQGDVAEMRAAAEGLTPDKIKLVLASCGIPDIETYGAVPKAKVPAFTAALAGAERS